MAVGGDGTVNEVVNGIAGLDVELAVIPRGTGWDFVRTYGIPRKLEAAVEVALRGRTRVIDLGRAHYLGWDGAEREALFANVASAGMSGAIAKRANETSKALGGKVSYAWATFSVFSRWRNGEVTVRVDGEEHRGRMHDVIVANGRYLGGGMKMLPEAEPDDGRLDVLLIGDLTKRDLLLTLPKTYRGTHLPHPKATRPEGRGRGGRVARALARPAGRRAAGHDAGALRDRAAGAAPAGPGLGLRLGLRLGGCRLGAGLRAGLDAFESSSTFFSSESTRRSSASRPRTFF